MKKIYLGASVRSFGLLLLAAASLASPAYCQAGQSAAEKSPPESTDAKIARQIEEIRQDKEMAMFDVEQLAEARVAAAIPAMEEKFARMPGNVNDFPSWETVDKAHVASALIRLGDSKEVYWSYLMKLATEAIDSDVPDPLARDAEGKAMPGISPQFEKWADAHQLPHAGLWDKYRYLLPGPVSFLAMTGDPRAIPLLRRGLLSPNFLVRYSSAEGLAQVGDKSSVPFILEACRKAPPDDAALIARSLVYFDDPEAQKAVDQYVPREVATALREDKARGKTKPLP